jgi:hypothetical protein
MPCPGAGNRFLQRIRSDASRSDEAYPTPAIKKPILLAFPITVAFAANPTAFPHGSSTTPIPLVRAAPDSSAGALPLVFARRRWLRVSGLSGLVFLLLGYLAPIAVAARSLPDGPSLTILISPELQFPGFERPGEDPGASPRSEKADDEGGAPEAAGDTDGSRPGGSAEDVESPDAEGGARQEAPADGREATSPATAVDSPTDAPRSRRTAVEDPSQPAPEVLENRYDGSAPDAKPEGEADKDDPFAGAPVLESGSGAFGDFPRDSIGARHAQDAPDPLATNPLGESSRVRAEQSPAVEERPAQAAAARAARRDDDPGRVLSSAGVSGDETRGDSDGGEAASPTGDAAEPSQAPREADEPKLDEAEIRAVLDEVLAQPDPAPAPAAEAAPAPAAVVSQAVVAPSEPVVLPAEPVAAAAIAAPATAPSAPAEPTAPAEVTVAAEPAVAAVPEAPPVAATAEPAPPVAVAAPPEAMSVQSSPEVQAPVASEAPADPALEAAASAQSRNEAAPVTTAPEATPAADAGSEPGPSRQAAESPASVQRAPVRVAAPAPAPAPAAPRVVPAPAPVISSQGSAVTAARVSVAVPVVAAPAPPPPPPPPPPVSDELLEITGVVLSDATVSTPVSSAPLERMTVASPVGAAGPSSPSAEAGAPQSAGLAAVAVEGSALSLVSSQPTLTEPVDAPGKTAPGTSARAMATTVNTASGERPEYGAFEESAAAGGDPSTSSTELETYGEALLRTVYDTNAARGPPAGASVNGVSSVDAAVRLPAGDGPTFATAALDVTDVAPAPKSPHTVSSDSGSGVSSGSGEQTAPTIASLSAGVTLTAFPDQADLVVSVVDAAAVLGVIAPDGAAASLPRPPAAAAEATGATANGEDSEAPDGAVSADPSRPGTRPPPGIRSRSRSSFETAIPVRPSSEPMAPSSPRQGRPATVPMPPRSSTRCF